jgi:hypothetical protein
MAKEARKLNAVEYTRPYEAEKQSRIQLLGDSRWLRDLELLLEDEWKSLKRYPDPDQAIQKVTEDLPQLLLVEPLAYSSDTFKWIELGVQNGIKTTVIGFESINMFEWMSISRRAAALDVGSILFSTDVKKAALEISEFLGNCEALKASTHIAEIQSIRQAFHGYQCAVAESEDELPRSLFSLIADEFALSSENLAMASILLETCSLWKKPKRTDSPIFLAYRRVERELDGTQTMELLNIAIKTSAHFLNSGLSEDEWNSQVDSSLLGLLSKRRMKKKYIEVRSVLELSSGQRTLKIA